MQDIIVCLKLESLRHRMIYTTAGLFVIFLGQVVFAAQDTLEITIDQGTLRGKYEESRGGRVFRAFMGIPFAQPPVGELRFEAPLPATPWKGILDSSRPHVECTQRSFRKEDPPVIGKEDCLFLNVYTPQLNNSGNHLLPVIFFIHGGFFTSGCASSAWYGPEIFLDRDIVLVAANYRISALGFLTTGDEVVPGNNGLKDQSLALKWVKNNIAAFGGDPDRITVYGQSSGGVAADNHMISPLSRHLIKGVIAESGTAFVPWGIPANMKGVRNSRKLAGLLNCPTSPSTSMIQCLKKVDAVDIAKQEDKFIEWGRDPLRPFIPVIEPNIKGAFFSEHPEDIIRSGKAANIPLMTGITTDEGGDKAAGYYTNPAWIKEMNKKFNKVVPIILEYDNHPDKNNISKNLREFYFGPKTIDNRTKGELTKMFTDAVYLLGAHESVRIHKKFCDHPVYYYLFGYRGSQSYCKHYGDLTYNYGVCHADDQIYLFNDTRSFPDFKPTETDEEMMEVLTTLYANFAAFGNPTPQNDSAIPAVWKPVQSNDMEYLFIKNPHNMEMAKGLYAERVKFLKNINIYPNNSIMRIDW